MEAMGIFVCGPRVQLTRKYISLIFHMAYGVVVVLLLSHV